MTVSNIMNQVSLANLSHSDVVNVMNSLQETAFLLELFPLSEPGGNYIK